jgi:hypothetical protein
MERLAARLLPPVGAASPAVAMLTGQP